MSSYELSLSGELNLERVKKQLIQRYERSRISSDQVFEAVYSDYNKDMERVSNREQTFQNGNSEEGLGMVAEALVHNALTKHEISSHLQFRPASKYDDLFKGTDILVEPKGNTSSNQAFAGIDVTINQDNIDKGVDATRFTSEEMAEPVGLEAKLARSRDYTDRLAAYDATAARDLLAWLESGGLNQPRTRENKDNFIKAESVLAMKYYRAPDTAPDPGKPSYIIGGPHPIISLDTYFVNKALQGGQQAEGLLADLAVVEFVMGIQAERKYLEELVRQQKERNVLFDKHYAKVLGWSYIFENPMMTNIVNAIIKRQSQNLDFQKQLNYYSNALAKINK
ncbi:MAG TPA: hypothetical protein PKA42_00650 [Candidatus Paceibacterota bacterium]|nr:hypothetical protein [Candidatus Paceibacterota bacterium]HMO82651.1 hypothetical protein [Candidatus Paceibacterota bacterium]